MTNEVKKYLEAVHTDKAFLDENLTEAIEKLTASREASRQTFADVIRAYEAYARTGKGDGSELLELATAIAYSVLKKIIDASDNKRLIKVRRDFAETVAILEATENASREAYGTKITEDGDYVRIIKDKDAHEALKKLVACNLGDGYDIVNEAVVAILEATENAKSRCNLAENFMEQPYEVRKLKKKVYIKREDSKGGWEAVETTPIQEVYKAVRRYIESIQSPRANTSGYIYISELVTDPEGDAEDIIYRRYGKYADLGGEVTDVNGKAVAYVGDEHTAENAYALIEKMQLSAQQVKILELRLSGYGYQAIATYLGVRESNVRTQIKRIQEKAAAVGFKL